MGFLNATRVRQRRARLPSLPRPVTYRRVCQNHRVHRPSARRCRPRPTSTTTTSSRMASPARATARLTIAPTHAPTAASRSARPAARASVRAQSARQSSNAVRRRPRGTGGGSWRWRQAQALRITRAPGCGLFGSSPESPFGCPVRSCRRPFPEGEHQVEHRRVPVVHACYAVRSRGGRGRISFAVYGAARGLAWAMGQGNRI